jgi:hypothetical protein
MLTGQRHTKKDYEKLKSMNLNDVVRLTKEERRVQTFEDPTLDTVVKVENKKNFKRRPKQEQLEKDQEIQKLLDTPQDINYEKAMALYEEQPLEAKELTQKDKKRLRRLKKKVEREGAALVKAEGES